MEEKFILVSLHEKKSKDIATVMSNQTARKILDALSEKEKVSPKTLSQTLNIPLPTITHALRLLEKEGFIIRADHVWSEKGRKISLYSLAKKMILIVPKGYDWKESMKKILPFFFLGIGVSIALRLFSLSQEKSFSAQSLAADSTEMVLLEESTQSSIFLPQEAWVYTLIATFMILFVFFLIDLWRQKK